MNTLSMRVFLVLAALSAVCLTTVRAEEKPAAEAVPPSVLKKYDRNKDGMLDKEERAKWEGDKAAARERYQKQRAEMLEKFDTDKDGRLSEEERASAKISMERARTEEQSEKRREQVAKEEQAKKEAPTMKAGSAE